MMWTSLQPLMQSEQFHSRTTFCEGAQACQVFSAILRAVLFTLLILKLDAAKPDMLAVCVGNIAVLDCTAQFEMSASVCQF